MKMRFFIIGIVILVVLGALWWFTIPQEDETEDDRLQVVTTFAPLYIFAANVARDAAHVENLLPSGVGPHDYSFSPRDVAKIADADVVIKQGRGIDDWVDEVIRAAGKTDIKVIVASDGIEAHTGTPDIASSLVRPDVDDPHSWLDPFLVAQEVENIRDGLMAEDPGSSEIYARNAEEYILKLLELDSEIHTAFRDLLERNFVSFHPAFRYFAYEYGLREVGVIEEIPGREPTPQELARLIEDVRRAGVKVIFSEPQFSPKIVELLHRDYNLEIAELDPLETGEFRVDYYEKVIRKNIATLVSAFQK